MNKIMMDGQWTLADSEYCVNTNKKFKVQLIAKSLNTIQHFSTLTNWRRILSTTSLPCNVFYDILLYKNLKFTPC